MIRILLLFLFCFSLNLSFSQGTDVLSSEQFCSGTSSLTFNNIFGGSDNTQVGCLGSIPNAAYFYLEIDQPGDLIFTISQQDLLANPIDVDFIVWGPFTDLTDADNTISFTDCPACPNNTGDPTFYPYLDTAPNPDSPIVDCSYSINATETMNILNAMPGEIYVVLITNYNGSEGTINFQQTGGAGTTTCANMPVCGSQFLDTGGATGDYFNNESYTTTINPYFAGGTVTVDFTSFNLGSGDVLTVYNGPNNTFPVLGTVTGAPSTFTSNTTGNPSGAITFEFTSDGSNVGSGWISDITCTAPPTPPTCGSTFYDSGGAAGNYSNNELITTTYFPDTPGDAVTATFTAFSTELTFDELYIYDGPNTASPLLGVFSGSTIPGPFTSSDPSGALTFVFDTDFSVVDSGYAVDFTCAPYVPPTICGSMFTDSGGVGGNYSNNQNITTTLTPDIPGTTLVATFTSFETENTYDFLYIYDGPNNTFPLIGTYTGTNNPGTVTSTHSSGSLTFVFTSDSSVTDPGWVADITCVNICNVSITDTNYPLGSDDCNLDYTELVSNVPPPDPTNIVFSESFDAATFPTGWTTVNGAASANWIISNSNNAGGTANEAMLDWTTGSHNSTWRLNSPLIDITGQTNLHLGFSHYFDVFTTTSPPTNITIFVETSTDNTNWTSQYSVNDPTGDVTSVENIDISALDGNTNLYIRFRLSGNSLNLFDWSIDDISITADGTPSPPQVTWSPATGLYTDATLTTPYIAGDFAGTVYAAPNGVQAYTATETANGCTDTVTVTYNKKIWDGSVNNNWYVANNWTPAGIPTIDNCIVIPDNGTIPNIPTANKFLSPPPLPPLPAEVRNLTVEANGYLEIETNTELIVQEWVNVQNTGILHLKSSSSLVQIEDSAVNSGSIHMERSPNFDESAVLGTEYVYWSSPVANFIVGNISPTSTQLYEWMPTVGGNGIGNHGEWAGATGIMSDATGYIVRGLSGTPNTIPATMYAVPNNTALFSGVPNNGVVTKQIFHGGHNSGPYAGNGNTATNEDDNWNLLGNPYPSAISANAFTNFNTNINGTIYLWPHSSVALAATTDPFYEDFVYNYDGNDYIEHNNTGSNPPGTNDLFIGSGQAFFVLMNHAATSGSNVTFDNSMRQLVSTYNNDTFYRPSGAEEQNSTIAEKHRIWLDLLAPNNITNTLLVGYVPNATNDFDRLYDGYDFSQDDTAFYSILDDHTLSIQGREVPFSPEDTVPLGIVANETGEHTIAINTLDGLFTDENQDIYIEDTALNSIHNIRVSPYLVTLEPGTYNNRFILRFTNTTLGVDDHDPLSGIQVFEENDNIVVKSEHKNIQSIDVYDILGRTLFTNKTVNTNRLGISSIKPSEITLFLKIRLVDGKQKIVKIIF